MSFVRTLLLVVVAAGLGAWLWFVEKPGLEQEARSNILLDFDPAAVERIGLAYPDGTTIGVVRENGAWKLTSPVVYAAEQSMIDNFLTTVKDAKIERRLTADEAEAPASYGLDSETGSQGRLELTLAGGVKLPAIRVGIATPVDYQAFVRKEGDDDILVIPLLLHSSVRKTTDELRRKSLFGDEAGGFTKVVLEKPDERIELEQRGEGAWAMLSPVADDADAEAVETMLSSLASIDAVKFFDGDAADRAAFGLAEGATLFTATRADGSSLRFTLGKEATDAPAGFYFERASDRQVAKVPDWVAKTFAPEAAELRGRRLLACKADEILRLSWTVGSGPQAETFTVSREAADKPWSLSPLSEGETVNQKMIDNVLRALVEARADSVVGDAASDADLASFGLDAPVARLEVATAAGSCASLSAAPAPAPVEAPVPTMATRMEPILRYRLKNAGRSAILETTAHQFSRLSMKRTEFVEVAATPSATPSAGGLLDKAP